MTDNENIDESHELEKIRIQKMKMLLEAQKRKQQQEDVKDNFQDKIEFVLKTVLNPDAYSYFNQLKQNEPQVYQQIFNELVSPEVIRNIDYLIAIIQRQRGILRRIPLDVIMYLERQIKGIKGSIKVKRGDEIQDLGSYLTKEK